jgi:membrane AbrB-like protein
VRQASVLLAIGLSGALAGALLGIPAGLFVGAMVAVAAAKLAVPRLPRPPQIFGDAGKLLIGTAIGATFNRQLLDQLGRLLLPTIAATLALIAAGLVLGWLLSRLTGLDLATALFCLTPGGIAEMVAAAEELDVDTPVIASIQFLRLTSVLVFVPIVVDWLFS